MLQKIKRKLTATLVATATAFTLLFMAQSAQAWVESDPGPISEPTSITIIVTTQDGEKQTATVPENFDIGWCLVGGISSVVTIGDIYDLVGPAGRVLKIAKLFAKHATILTVAGTAISIVKSIAKCVEWGTHPPDISGPGPDWGPILPGWRGPRIIFPE